MKRKWSVLAAAFIAIPAQAATDVMSFEDLVPDPTTDFVAVPGGYHGLDWHGVRVFDPARWAGGAYAPLYDQGIASGTILATNMPVMTISSTAPFDFVGAFLSSAEGRPVTLEVTGTVNGAPVYVQAHTLSEASGRFYDFGFLGVDSLSFFSWDVGPTRFTVDDFTINTAVPEPSTGAALLAGLAGLAAAGRRRRARPFREGP